MALTKYNGYTITPGRWNPLTSEDLEAIKAHDDELARIDAMSTEERKKALDRAKHQRYYAKNRERIRARQAAYREAHRDENNQRVAKWRAENREIYLARMREAWHRRKEQGGTA